MSLQHFSWFVQLNPVVRWFRRAKILYPYFLYQSLLLNTTVFIDANQCSKNYGFCLHLASYQHFLCAYINLLFVWMIYMYIEMVKKMTNRYYIPLTEAIIQRYKVCCIACTYLIHFTEFIALRSIKMLYL